MATSILRPLTLAVCTRLRADAALMALAAGSVRDDAPQGVLWPFVLVEVKERDARGFGTGTLPEVELRVRSFSQTSGMKEAQDLNNLVVESLKDQALTVTGFTHCGGGLWHDDSVQIPNSEVNGIKCREIVGMFHAFFEKAA